LLYHLGTARDPDIAVNHLGTVRDPDIAEFHLGTARDPDIAEFYLGAGRDPDIAVNHLRTVQPRLDPDAVPRICHLPYCSIYSTVYRLKLLKPGKKFFLPALKYVQ
jgi:hypothetical protein